MNDGQPVEVLYIEDNQVNAVLVARILERAPGVRLTVCPTGESGFATACTLKPALILLDLQLPDIDGFEILRRLRHDEGHRGPVFVLTADASAGSRERAAFAGADLVLTKPLDVAEFLQAVTLTLRAAA